VEDGNKRWDWLLPGVDGTANPEDDQVLAERMRRLSLPRETGDSRRETVLNVDVGQGTWRESAPLGRPVVAAGAWQGAAFVADLYVITSPSRVRLVIAAPRAVATGNIVPLTGPDLLRQLRSPLMTRPDVA
jgi:hypothetical protein